MGDSYLVRADDGEVSGGGGRGRACAHAYRPRGPSKSSHRMWPARCRETSLPRTCCPRSWCLFIPRQERPRERSRSSGAQPARAAAGPSKHAWGAGGPTKARMADTQHHAPAPCRTQRLFEQQDLAQLIEKEGAPAAASSVFGLEVFDNTDYESRRPSDWVPRAQGEGCTLAHCRSFQWAGRVPKAPPPPPAGRWVFSG
jgi:hypothetical protein